MRDNSSSNNDVNYVSDNKLASALLKECYEIDQILGKALGYPNLKDDKKNFPDQLTDYYCTGEHVPVTLAMQAAKVLGERDRQLTAAREALCLAPSGDEYRPMALCMSATGLPQEFQEHIARYDAALKKARAALSGGEGE